MNARLDLGDLLDEWLDLSQAEGAAIQSADWPRVKQIQAEKAQLREPLSQLQSRLGDTSRFADRIARLLSLETRNGELFAVQLSRWHAERDALDQAGKNLRRIQRSYVLRRPGPRWDSYS